MASKKPKAEEPVAGPQGPSPAWLRLMQKKKMPADPSDRGIRRKGTPCTCPDWNMEDGSLFNPWVYGHVGKCPLFMKECPDCKMSSGTHTRDCSFWDTHPLITPF